MADKYSSETSEEDSGRGDGVIRKKPKRERKYRREWEKKFPWLKPSKKNPYKAVCHKCNVELTAEITPIKLHEKSAKHIQNCAAPSTSRTIAEAFASAKGQTSKSDAVKAAEIKLTAWMMEHNISFRAADHLCDVLKDCFPDSEITRNLKMKRTKCQSVCRNILAKCHKEELGEKLRHNKFSILVDESTDISTSQNVCIVVRLAEEAAVVSKFWDLVPIFSNDDPEGANEGATSSRIFSSIMKSLNNYEVPVSNIIGFGSDGCSTMMGKNNSVSSKFKDLCPGIYIMKCICHSAHLCASEACKELPKEVEQLAHDVHNSLKHSSKRLAQFSEFQEFSGAVKHKILSPSRTRWLSYTAVVKRMLEQWGPLQLYFTDLNLQQCKTTNTAVKNACENLHNPFIKLYYCFLDSVLPKFTQLNLLFQSERVVITDLHGQVCDLYKQILLMYLRRDYVMKTPLYAVDPGNEREFLILEQIYLGASTVKRLSENPALERCKEEITRFRGKCRAFLATAAVQIKRRFDFCDPVLSELHVLEPASALGTRGSRVPSLVPLAVKLPRIIDQDDSTLQQLDDEWRKLGMEDLPENIKDMSTQTEKVKDKHPDKFWCALKTLVDDDGAAKYKCVSDFALGCLSLPHANADCERCFSDINRVKTKDRNKLHVETVRDIILAKQSVVSTGSNCTTFKPSRIMVRNMTSSILYPAGEDSSNESPDPGIFMEELQDE